MPSAETMRMNTLTRFSYLKPNSLLSGLSDADRLAVLRRARVTEFRRRQRIYRPGEPASDVYMVESGIVKLAVENTEGREAILGFQHPGDLFGEMAVIDDGPHDHLAEAYENSIVWAISRDVFLDQMRELPALGQEVIKLLGLRLRMYRTRVREILHQSAHSRVASTLVHLAGRHGVEDADGVVIPLRLSQRDIANLVGLTRETVNFILKDLRERNLIETQGRSIRVKNPAVLQHAVR
ncbi:MAG: hypothetical protein CL477_05460 [Acidobacteria bacterium]|nr:hypothetical protein [Acidobacteriota bacterium]MDP7337739.1 Crp/Fnr family transcriptional regulator [Vicinamibacterales bacterium]